MLTLGEVWDDKASNAQQKYLTHGAFRYFGKLPPTLTGRILDEMGVREGSTVLDLMAGSGTTLIEAGTRGANCLGVDCNDLSVLVARVKTRAGGCDAAVRLYQQYASDWRSLVKLSSANDANKFLANSDQLIGVDLNFVTATRNFDRWFPPSSAFNLRVLRHWVFTIEDEAARDVALVAFAAIIRAASTASTSAGRIFYDVDKNLANPFRLFEKSLSRIMDGLRSLSDHPNWSDSRVRIELGDAKTHTIGLSDVDLVLLHPPYFALYKYSSDVLRFELDWLGLPRSPIAKREIVDGFKTVDDTLVNDHVKDMLAIMKNAASVAKPNGRLVMVTANSTLRKQILPIIEMISERSKENGWALTRRIERKVRFAQASYHRSADKDIVRPSDEVLIFNRA